MNNRHVSQGTQWQYDADGRLLNQQSIPVNTTAKNRARVPFKYAETALHELVHIAGKNGYYGHAIMDASAGFFEPGLSFDQAMKKHCIPVENQ